MSVPVRLARYGLSEVVNHLLGNEEPETIVPFDFLYDQSGGEDKQADPEEGETDSGSLTSQRFLRSSLARLIQRGVISAEAILELEYVPAKAPPKTGPSLSQPDWIASVDAGLLLQGAGAGTAGQGLGAGGTIIITGGYDCNVHVHLLAHENNNISSGNSDSMDEEGYDEALSWKLQELTAERGHTMAVKSVAVTALKRWGKGKGERGVSAMVVSASQDMTAKVWNLEVVTGGNAKARKKKKGSRKKRGGGEEDESEWRATLRPLTTCKGHKASLTAASIGPSRQLVATASWDHTVRLWKVGNDASSGEEGDDGSEEVENDEEGTQPPKKRRVQSLSSSSSSSPSPSSGSSAITLKGSTDAVNAIAWASPRSLFSGGFDHAIRAWDVATGRQLHCMDGNKVRQVLSLLSLSLSLSLSRFFLS